MSNKEQITKTFTVTASKDVMKRFERFLALLHYNSSFGHSNHFGMYLDGDGPEKLRVNEVNHELHREVELIGSTAYDVEIANTDNYSGLYKDRHKENSYHTESEFRLMSNGEVRKRRGKVLDENEPSRDWKSRGKWSPNEDITEDDLNLNSSES